MTRYRISWTVSTEGDATTSGLRPRFPGRSNGVPTAPARWGGSGTAGFAFRRHIPLPLFLDRRSFPRFCVGVLLQLLGIVGNVCLERLGVAALLPFGWHPMLAVRVR